MAYSKSFLKDGSAVTDSGVIRFSGLNGHSPKFTLFVGLGDVLRFYGDTDYSIEHHGEVTEVTRTCKVGGEVQATILFFLKGWLYREVRITR